MICTSCGYLKKDHGKYGTNACGSFSAPSVKIEPKSVWRNRKTGREARVLSCRGDAVDYRYVFPDENSRASKMTSGRRMTVPSSVDSFLDRFEPPSGVRGYTDYPFVALGDKSGEEAPVREVEVLWWDGNKMCRVLVDGKYLATVKYGYLYAERGRSGEVPLLNIATVKEVAGGF